VNIVLDKRKRNKLLNTLDNNVDPKNLRRSTRISSQKPKVSKKTSQLPSDVAVPSVLGIDLDDLPGEVPVMRRDIYGRPLPQW
jgi:hypothetical protein